MAHIKIISPAGWNFDGPVATLVKVASSGLRGHDRSEFIKRAGEAAAAVFLPYLDSVKLAKDEVPVHLLGLGSEEAWGANRNGDAFEEKEAKDCHGTFLQYSRFFRNHRNKPHEGHHHYGLPKAAAYNPTMRRVECLYGLFGTKEAAERTGDSLARVADRELEKLASGGDLAVSMACRVPYDVCVACGNKARTRDEYCKEASCPAGGCYDNLSRLVKMGGDVHHVRVRNVRPAFFDMSDVFRPADRTCYGNVADYLTKMASDGGFADNLSSKLAEDLGVYAPIQLVMEQDALLMPGEWGARAYEQVKLAYGLDHLDRTGAASDPGGDVRRAFTAEVQSAVDLADLRLDPARPEKMAAALGALADRKIVLPLREFARMTKRADVAPAAVSVLRGVYGRMLADGSLERRVRGNPYVPAEKLASAAERQAADRLVPGYSLDRQAVADRSALAVVRGVPAPVALEKQAADEPAEALARDYALYKLAALQRIARFDNDFVLTCRLSSVQNQVS